MIIKHNGLGVLWLDYTTVRIKPPDDFVVYFDPGHYGVLNDYYARNGDLILVTHNHHYDSDTIEQVADTDVTIVAFEGVDAATIGRDVVSVESLLYGTIRVNEEAHLTINKVGVWPFSVFGDPDDPHLRNGDVVHLQGFGCGFHISTVDRTVFWPGDSNVLEGYKHLEVSLFPVSIGGPVVINYREAADLAETLDSDFVLPIHYGTVPLLETDLDALVVDAANRGTLVVLDDPDQV